VIDFPDLVPFQLRRVLNRHQAWTFPEFAAAHRIEPVAIATILGDTLPSKRRRLAVRVIFNRRSSIPTNGTDISVTVSFELFCVGKWRALH
jgi:hypothetical protein